MPRKVSETANVTHVDAGDEVEESGFYIVEKESYENTVVPHDPDGNPIEGHPEITLGRVLGKRVYPDTRPRQVEMVPSEDDPTVMVEKVTFEPESGWFHEPTVTEGGEE